MSADIKAALNRLLSYFDLRDMKVDVSCPLTPKVFLLLIYLWALNDPEKLQKHCHLLLDPHQDRSLVISIFFTLFLRLNPDLKAKVCNYFLVIFAKIVIVIWQ